MQILLWVMCEKTPKNGNSLVYIGFLVLWQACHLKLNSHLCTCSCSVGKKQVPFSMVIGNMELMHE